MARTNGASDLRSTRRTTIPTVLTSFIGREREIAEVAWLLASSRLVTLTGAAGCGKTRLAMRIAADARHYFPDGVHWIELARLTDARHVPQAVVRAVDAVDQPRRPVMDRLVDALPDKQLLLVLDNCEHVWDACSRLVEVLLSASDVTILATSREPMSVRGERLYPVLPMALPPPTHTADDIGQFDAIQLFIERTRAILPNFALTPDNAMIVANICHRLDGLPLAICSRHRSTSC